MGREFVISSLEEMCDLMCGNIIPKEKHGRKNDKNGDDKAIWEERENASRGTGGKDREQH